MNDTMSNLYLFLSVFTLMFISTKEHMRHVLLDEFHKGVNANTATKSIQNIYGNNTLNEKSFRS